MGPNFTRQVLANIGMVVELLKGTGHKETLVYETSCLKQGLAQSPLTSEVHCVICSALELILSQ